MRDTSQRVSVEVIRVMADKWLDEKEDGDKLRKACRLGSKVGHATVCGWLSQFGCVFGPKGKTFYVDGHEWEEVVMSRYEFLAVYKKREEKAPVWVSLSSGTSLTNRRGFT